MAERKAFLGPMPKHPELDRLLTEARQKTVTDEELREQRVSFAYGNAPLSSGITKESVRAASTRMRLKPR